MGADGTGLGEAGSDNHVRFTDAPFIEPALAAPQGQVGGRAALRGGEPAIVGHEDHNGIFREVVLIKGVKDLANRRVHGLHHGGIHGMPLADAHLARRGLCAPGLPDLFLGAKFGVFTGSRKCGCLLPVLGHEVRFALEGGVHRIKGEVEQEGAVLV